MTRAAKGRDGEHPRLAVFLVGFPAGQIVCGFSVEGARDASAKVTLYDEVDTRSGTVTRGVDDERTRALRAHDPDAARGRSDEEALRGPAPDDRALELAGRARNHEGRLGNLPGRPLCLARS